MSRLIEFVKALPTWRFVLLFVFSAIVLSELLVILQSLWLYGEVRPHLLQVGFITPAIVSFALVYFVTFIVNRLKKTEQAHLDAQEMARVGHWEIDIPSGKALWSEALRRIMGVGPDVQVGPELLARIIHPADRDAQQRALKNALENGDCYNVEYRVLHPDGDECWVHSKADCQLDEHGRVLKLNGIAQDITQRKITELALRESQERLKLAGRAAYDLIYEWDVASDTLYWFGDVDSLLGFESGCISRDIDAWLALIHPEDREKLAGAVEEHRTATDPIEYEYRIKNSSGDYSYWVDYGLPLLDEAQRPRKWVGVCTDITERKMAEEALLERETLLRTVLDEMPDVVLLKDYKGDYLLANQALAKLYNIKPEEVAGKQDDDFGVPKEMAEFFRQNVLSIMAKGETEIVFEDSRDAVTGEIRHFRSIKKPFKDTEGKNQILVIAQDITDVIHANEKVAESENILRTILDNVHAHIYMKDTEGRYLFANRLVRELWNAEMEEIVGYGDEKFFDSITARKIRANDRRVLVQGEEVRVEEENTVPETGKTGVFKSIKLPLRREDGEIYALCGISVDITEQKAHQEELEYIAHYDGLTRLPNRVLLADRLKQAMAQAQRRDQRLAVVYLDLDAFKPVNDRYGHQTGDLMLKSVADRMKETLREGDTIARLGGDEFVAVLIDYPGGREGEQLLNRLVSAVAQPVHVKELVLRISASLGVTFYPQTDELDADQLLRQADQAMYLAKLAGKNRWHFFDSKQDRDARGRHKSIERIRDALDNGEFELFYQPKVNMRTGAVIGTEALIRWQHPDQGLLTPNYFLPVIHENILAVELGEWVIETALKQVESWQDQGLNLTMSVNVSTIQLEQSDFVPRLKQLLEAHPKVPPGYLELEIVETSALEDIAEVSRIMRACREFGVSFALDDFGTGYSSLTYLKRLPARHLKIDRSFVRDMLDDPDDLSILEGVIGLASAFRLTTVAEGVETEEHGKMLLQLGCELAQGFGIARPMMARDIPEWIAEWELPAVWRGQQLVGRDALPLLSASVEHRAWIDQIQDYLLMERAHPPELDHQNCRFGKWLNQAIDKSREHDPSMQSIDKLHRKIHLLANQLCQHAEAGNREPLLDGLKDLTDMRDALLNQINDLY
jgi:diguanylate cyclase (GGDEF)-like protein/PAS domain S-box-containing protein